MASVPFILVENIARVRGRIAEAARTAGRSADEVTLVAVTKYATAATTRALFEAGCPILGESRPQQLWEKAERLADIAPQWHLIGHLQRNKVRRTLPYVNMIHSLDSLRLAESLGDECRAAGRRLPAMLEVNVSGEAAKHGFAPAEIEPLLPQLASIAGLEIRGLMCMAGLESAPAEARREFASLRVLRDRLQRVAPEGLQLGDLSMGMSGDFEAAIAEGSTLVRIGSALFEGIDA
ncbi:MAG: YggS family pyridoxal phosphate-dependent enzyme [Planctomycetota bacterium]